MLARNTRMHKNLFSAAEYDLQKCMAVIAYRRPVRRFAWRYMQEILPAVKKLWEGDYKHDGEYWSFPTSTSVPKPLQKPHPPLWVAARSPITYDYAIKNDCNVLCWPFTRPFSEAELYKQHFDQALKNSGKSEEIAKKISLGKINKFKEENSLMTQNWVMEPKKKVKDILSEINISDLKIKEFVRLKIGE